MNYKTIMLCAAIGISMHSACAMHNESEMPNRLKSATHWLARALDLCDQMCEDWRQIPEFHQVSRDYDAFRRCSFSQISNMGKERQLKRLARKLDAIRIAYCSKMDRALVGAQLYKAVMEKCEKEAITVENDIRFARLSAKIVSHKRAIDNIDSASTIEIVNRGIEAGHLAIQLKAVLMKIGSLKQ